MSFIFSFYSFRRLFSRRRQWAPPGGSPEEDCGAGAATGKMDYPFYGRDLWSSIILLSCIPFFIIADSFQQETVEQLRLLPLTVFEVSFDKSTKTNRLNEAFRRIGQSL